MSAPVSGPDADLSRVRAALPRTSLGLDPEALALYVRAVRIGQVVERDSHGGSKMRDVDPPVTFTSGVLALLTGQDSVCSWFNSRSQELGPKLDAILGERRLEKAKLYEALEAGLPTDLPPTLLSISARRVLSNADEWANTVGAQEIGVRHVLAAYLVNPPADHRKELLGWEMNAAAWPTELSRFAASLYTSERWGDILASTAKAASLNEAKNVSEEDLAWGGDDDAVLVMKAARDAHAHAKAKGWLKTRMLLFALVEVGHVNTSVKAAARPLFVAVEKAREAYERKKQEINLGSWKARQGDFPDRNLDLTPQLANLLETARLLAISATQQARVGVHHLLGALVSERVEADDELVSIGLALPELRTAVLEHVRTRYPTEDEAPWRGLLGPEVVDFVGRPVQLNSDEPYAVIESDRDWKRDPLSFRSDVHTFAGLLAAKSLEPPLSIGLFGAWGSGKTTFMRRLRNAVESYASGEGSAFVREIVSVDFNAWHYAETNLVASMVDKILASIRAHQKKSDPAEAEKPLWVDADAALASAQQRAEQARIACDAARAEAQAKEQKLEQARDNERTKQQAVVSASSVAWNAFVGSIEQNEVVKSTGILASVRRLEQDHTALRARLTDLRASPGAALQLVGWPAMIGFALVLILVAPAVSWLLARLAPGNGVLSAVTQISGVLGTLALGLRKASDSAATLQKAIDTVERELADKVEGSETVRTAREEAATATQAATDAEAELRTAEQSVLRAEAALAEATPASQIERLVKERLADRTYGKLLSTVSDARADFERLSSWVRAQPGAPAGVGARAVDRIILYVDDLDRCKPPEVVQVLQLIHMLLAFPLFVVVVAVDARWVRQSLVRSYDWLGEGKNGQSEYVTPEDYLEKIFQVAFWLEPMTVNQAASYMTSLVKAAPDAKPAKHDLVPVELDFLRMLAAHVGTSPRRVKRLVNAYRLIKAGLSDSQLEHYLERAASGKEGDEPRSGPYQIALALVVIGNGAPQMLDRIADSPPGERLHQLDQRLRSEEPRWVAEVIGMLRTTQGDDAEVAEIRGWARRVKRYFLSQGLDGTSRHSEAEASAAATTPPTSLPA